MRTSLWIEDAEPLPDTERELAASVEVAVVGGGIAGICVAFHLAARGVDVAVLEADRVAGRASGRNDGQLLLGLGEHYNRVVGQFGAEKARLLWSFIGANNQGLKEALRNHGIDCDLREAGGLRLGETEHEFEELRDASALLVREGIAHDLLTAGEVAGRLPARGFHGALHVPGEAVVQPVQMVRGLAAVAQANGATIHERARVRAIDGSGGAFSVHTGRGRLTAAVVVHCSSGLAPELDTSGFLSAQLFPFRGQILASEPLPTELAAQFGEYAMSSNFCYEYFRVHGRRFVVGGMRWRVPGEEQGITDDSCVNHEVSDRLRDYLGRHFPTLDGVDFPRAWTGIMAGTNDGLPLLGALPGRAGEFCNLGYNGYGLSFAWLAGSVLAEQIVDGRAGHPATPLFAPRRFA